MCGKVDIFCVRIVIWREKLFRRFSRHFFVSREFAILIWYLSEGHVVGVSSFEVGNLLTEAS